MCKTMNYTPDHPERVGENVGKAWVTQKIGHPKRCMGTCMKSICSDPVCTAPPKFEPLAAKPLAANQLAATFYPLTALSLTAGHLKRVTCSKIRHLQQKQDTCSDHLQ